MKAKGLTFEHAWRLALQRVKWPHDKQSRHEWQRVLNSMKDTWRECFYDEGQPIDVGALVQALSHDVDEEALALV